MMHKPRLVAIAIVAILIALVILGFFVLFRPKPTKLADTGDASAYSPQSRSQGAATAPSNPTPTPDLSIYKTDPKWIWWNEQSSRDPQFEWKMPIVFYGKVIDQQDQPLDGVEVVFQWTDMSAKGTSEKAVFSDTRGLFELKNVRGKRLAINQIRKKGYYREEQGVQTSFEYAAFFEENYHVPDQGNPVIFRMHKAGEISKDLLVRESLVGVAPNGAPQPLDLRTMQKTVSGDVMISITRGEPKGGRQYDWGVSIAGVNGAGLIESNEEFMFEAPEQGYLPQYSYQFEAGSSEWQSQLRKKYYVRSGDGNLYASIDIKFMPKYQEGAAARVRFFVNPTGSRNLEYQPNKVLPR